MIIEEMLAYNKQFVAEKRYEQYAASKYPNKKIAILTCMDTRLVELLPAALGLKNGDVKIIKNAGGVVTNPFGSVIRSLLVAIIELGVEEIMVIGHTDCGVQHIDSDIMIHHMKQRGISQESIDLMNTAASTLRNGWPGSTPWSSPSPTPSRPSATTPSCPMTSASAAMSSTPSPGRSAPSAKQNKASALPHPVWMGKFLPQKPSLPP